MDYTKYKKQEDRLVETFEGIDSHYPSGTPQQTGEKKHVRDCLLRCLIEVFGTWEKKGDCLPPSIRMGLGGPYLFLTFDNPDKLDIDNKDLKDKLRRRNAQIKELKSRVKEVEITRDEAYKETWELKIKHNEIKQTDCVCCDNYAECEQKPPHCIGFKI